MALPQSSSLRNSEVRPLLNQDTLVDDHDDHNDEHDTSPALDEEEAERQLVRKVDKRMSILVLIYILNYMDRNNAGAARLRGFEEDLHLEGSQFATILSVLYISYVLMQIPSNMFLNYYKKPSTYLPWCMVIWGVLSLFMGSATSYHGVLLIRFLLGFAEAAYFPGALFLLTKWYKKSELSERTALLSSGILLSNAFGSLVASAILDAMNGFLGYAGWRWLFFVEGILTIGVAFWSMVVLPDFPENSDGWLTQAEKTLAVQRMARDAVGSGSDVDKSSSQWQGLSLAVHDWKVWWLAVALWSLVTALSYGVYFPTIAATMGFSATVSLLLCAPPWLVATYLGLKASRHSDQRGERFVYIAGSCGIGILGFAVAALTMNSFLRYLSMFAMAQMYIAFITFLAWTSGSVSHPPAKRAVALALINCVSQAGNVIGSYIWPSAWGPSYSRSFWLCILLTLISVGMCAIFRQHLRYLNEQAELEAEETGRGNKHKYMLARRTAQVGKIPDPFIGLHEWDVQWVGEAEWDFKTVFDVSSDELVQPNLDLVFDGLDTFATVKLNGETILKSDNQFIAHRVPIKDKVKPGSNELLIHFESAFLTGRDVEKAHEKYVLWNGDSSRLHVRKAQYNYGWDWGPVLMTVGPWKPIRLEVYTNRVQDLDIRTEVSEDLAVKLSANIAVATKDGAAYASISVKDAHGLVEASSNKLPTGNGGAHVQFDWQPGQLDLWYPVGYGAQPLYAVEVEIFDKDGTILDRVSKRIAFRRVVIVQEPLIGQEGRTFLFEVNNIRIFCGGSNWIPADSFLTTVTEQRYRDWLQLMVDGNQNMIRVWGGGIYEPDIFYDICDEIGLMVWQDFMFGCGQYPAYDSFVASVREEAIQNVKRLSHHPSVVIFAGNNEDYQVAESFKLDLDYADETSDFRKTNFPARYIYERVLPEVVAAHSNIFYHRGSPYSGFGKVTTDRTYGDIHQWNVWHGTQEPWHNWDILAGRFVSEFGMQGYPNIRTVDYWLGGDKTQRYPQSRVCNNHNKADGFERRLELYLMENFKHAFDIESYVYYTQIMQAETLASAYRLWRRNWQGRGKEYTAGALVWQINDCWPVTSWAITDYFLRPKPAYFAIARELRPFTVGMTRKEKQTFANDRSAADFTIETILEIWATNSTLEPKQGSLEVTIFDLDTDATESWDQKVTLAPNASTELFKGKLPGQPTRFKKSDVPKTLIISARLFDEDGTVLGRYSNWPEPFKFINFPSVESVGLSVVVGDGGEDVTLTAKKPIKGVVLDVEGEDVKWGDQAIDLFPGDPQTVKTIGLRGREVKARFLGDGTA